MDTNKLRKVLELALHPNTEQAESEAALKAARRMLGGKGLDTLLTTGQTTSSRTNNSKTSWTLQIPGKWHHALTEQVFLDAQKLHLQIKVISYKPVDPKHFSAGTQFEFHAYGAPHAIEKLDKSIKLYIQEINKETPTRKPAPRAPHTKPEPPKPKGWFSKWFGK
jgi:hypothetical protein